MPTCKLTCCWEWYQRWSVCTLVGLGSLTVFAGLGELIACFIHTWEIVFVADGPVSTKEVRVATISSLMVESEQWFLKALWNDNLLIMQFTLETCLVLHWKIWYITVSSGP